tara:strand:+ start:80177 stop:80821 length:645 start_codon:yes stop_codon:yes gene_type:complete
MEFLPEKIAEYAENHSQKESQVLSDLNRSTRAKVLQPRMLSGHLQGRVLSMFSKMIKPQRILEIGTYTGYSAICLAEGLSPEGKLISLDVNEEIEDFAKSYFEKSGFADSIEMIVGDALKIIPQLNEKWDLVFIDADKENYLNYLKLLLDNVNIGGYIIADNVLWSGKVVQEIKEDDEETKALVEFNSWVQENEKLENVLLPIRDGLMVCRKVQ